MFSPTAVFKPHQTLVIVECPLNNALVQRGSLTLWIRSGYLIAISAIKEI